MQNLKFDLNRHFIFLNSVQLEKHLLPIILSYTIYWHINKDEETPLHRLPKYGMIRPRQKITSRIVSYTFFRIFFKMVFSSAWI